MNIRKLARPAAALLAAAALMAGIPELRMEAQAAFPEYLKSVTYFGDAWPINYCMPPCSLQRSATAFA